MLTSLRHTRTLSLKSPLLTQRAVLVSTRAIHHNAGFSTKSPSRTASLAMKSGTTVQESVRYSSQQLSAITASATSSAPASPSRARDDAQDAIAKLPTASLFRNLLIQNISAYPVILSFLLSILKRHSDFFVKAPIFRHVIQYFFYAHYCAGATGPEISRTVQSLRQIGIKGVILNYAKEVDTPGVAGEGQEKAAESQKLHEQQVDQWLDGTLKTIEYAPSGDYVAIKFSGAGSKVVEMLEHDQEKPDSLFGTALSKVCDLARNKGVKLLVDAEHQCQQAAIDRWTMELMQHYNSGANMVIYNTYQMYLKASTAVLDAHLSRAAAEGFNFGAKLVRGAYLGSDPRHLIHDTKAATDAAYDAAAEKLATYHLQQPRPSIKVGIVLGSHNAASLRKIRAIRHQQAQAGQPIADVVYSQLMGMADELSLSLTTADQEFDLKEGDCDVYKYVTWGTMQECILYLVRRAEENRDAVASARDSRGLFWREMKRRMGLAG
ncbi:proline dehydrogenase [Diplodia seriata]|uniref:Proline dehydrogenase n=1 Tax=Diplodia seriata TaxID=420778 RepID=A0A1S8B5K0_9PEZI|nr:putative proline dehydrogenase, mitochondrial [Diplodia seriata]